MLQLKHIIKNYVAGDTTVKALKGVSVDFRKSEFVFPVIFKMKISLHSSFIIQNLSSNVCCIPNNIRVR